MLGFNPWLVVILGAVIVGATGASYLKGRADGKAVVIAAQAQAEAIRMETLHLAQMAAAEEISRIQINHTTIRQTAEQVIRERQIYLDCRNDDVVRGLLDAARENRDIPPGDRGVP